MDESANKKLMKLLLRERAALLVGDFGSVVALFPKKEELLVDLERTKVRQNQMEQLRTELSGNQILLAAALDGIGNAQRRLNELEKVRNNLTVYDQSGQLDQMQLARPALERKA